MANERTPRWYQNDKLLVPVLFLLLAILNISSVLAAQSARNAFLRTTETGEKADIIAECFTPDTRCSKFRAQADKEEREYLATLMQNTGLCTLATSGAVNTQQIPFELPAMEAFYRECIASRTGPVPEGSSLQPPPNTRSTR